MLASWSAKLAAHPPPLFRFLWQGAAVVALKTILGLRVWFVGRVTETIRYIVTLGRSCWGRGINRTSFMDVASSHSRGELGSRLRFRSGGLE